MDIVDVPATPRETTILELRDFSRKLVRELGFMRATLAETDLAPSAVHAILEIGMAPGISAKELGEILRLDKSNTSRQIAKLENEGLVERRPRADDARTSELYLTAEGQKRRKKIDRFATEQVSNALRRMVPADQQALLRSLALYADALAKDNAGKASTTNIEAMRIVQGYQRLHWRYCKPSCALLCGALGIWGFFREESGDGVGRVCCLTAGGWQSHMAVRREWPRARILGDRRGRQDRSRPSALVHR